MADNLFVDVRGTTEHLRNNLRLVGNDLGNLNRTTLKTTQAMGKSFKGLNQIIGASKIYVLGNQLAYMTKNAMDATETVNLFNVSLGNMAEEADASAQSLAGIGLDVTNLRNNIGGFALLARSMGMSTEQAKTLGVQTSQLAIDLASLTNIPIQQVMQDLRSGLVGQSETVYKYGIDVTEASLKTEALRQGISKSVRDMGQGEKMALRYAIMIRQSGLAQGDFAKTINEPANQLKILSERFMTLSRSIGTIFIPLLGSILPYLNAIVIVLIKVANAIAKFFGYEPPKVVGETKTAIGGISTEADKATGSVGKTTKAIKKMKNALAGFDELTIIKEQPTAGAGVGAGGIGAGMGDILGDFDLPTYDAMLDGIKSKADEIAESIINLGQTIYDFIMNIPIEPFVFFAGLLAGIKFVGAIPAMVEGFLGLAVALEGLKKLPIVGGFLDKVAGFALKVAIQFETLGTIIAGLSTGALVAIIAVIALVITTIVSLWKTSEDFRNSWIEVWNNIMDILSAVWNDVIKPIGLVIIEMLIDIWESALKPLWDKWKSAFEDISGILTDFINFALPIIKVLISIFGKVLVPILRLVAKVFVIVFSTATGVLESALDSIGKLIGNIRGIFQGLITFIKGVFTGDWKRAWSGVKQIFANIFGGIGNVAKVPINSMIGMINGFIRGVNRIKIPDWVPKYGGRSISIPQIPRLARGGSLSEGQLFEAGEFGKAEAIGGFKGRTTVMPLENTDFVSAMYNAVSDAVRDAMGDRDEGEKEIVLQVGSTEFGRVAINSINKVTKQEGRLALNI